MAIRSEESHFSKSLPAAAPDVVGPNPSPSLLVFLHNRGLVKHKWMVSWRTLPLEIDGLCCAPEAMTPSVDFILHPAYPTAGAYGLPQHVVMHLLTIKQLEMNPQYK